MVRGENGGGMAVTMTAAVEVEFAYRECERVTRSQAANFYYGIRLLPRFKRQAMCAAYAFARRVDDIGDDGGHDRGVQLELLAREREAVAALAAGRPHTDDPVAVALAHANRYYNLPLDALALLIDGVERDVIGSDYESFDELVNYCRCVAGSVGRLCVAIFSDGAADAHAHRLADDLGVAMQLTNILRDIVEDHERGRVYLPAQDRERFGCKDLFAAEPHAVSALVHFEAQRAAEWFARGLPLVEQLDLRSASCLQAMAGIYGRILERILADPGQVMAGRISLSPLEKTWVAARSLAIAGREQLR